MPTNKDIPPISHKCFGTEYFQLQPCTSELSPIYLILYVLCMMKIQPI